MSVLIYGLFDPRDGALRYVGKTNATLDKRLRQHICDANRRKFESLPRFRWIRKLTSVGLSPEIRTLKKSSLDCWVLDEKEQISIARESGAALLNATDGGDGISGYKHSESTRRKQSEAAFKRFSEPGSREKLSRDVRHGQSTPAGKRAACEGARKRFENDAYRIANAEHLRLISRSPEARLRSSRIHKGKKLTDEQKAAIGAANRGRKWSAEARARKSAQRTGAKHSQETILRLKKSLHEAWARRKAALA